MSEPGRGSRLRAAAQAVGGPGLVPLTVLVALAGVQNFDLVAFGVLSPDIRRTFGVSTGTITVIASVTAAVPIVFAVGFGYLGDRMNRVRLATVAAVFWGLTALLCGLAPVLWLLVIARLLGGVGLLSGETIYPSLLADYYPPQSLGRVFGGYRAGGQALALIGGPLAGLIAAGLGWRAAFVILALPTFVLAGIAYRSLTEPRGEATAQRPDPSGTVGIAEGYRQIRAIPTLRRTWIAAFLFGGGTIPFVTILSNFFKDVYHSGDTTRGLLTGLYGVGGLLGMIVGGWLTHRAVRGGRPERLAVINAVLIGEFAVGILAMSAAPVFWLSAAAATLLSIGGYGFLPVYTTLVATVTPARLRSQAYAWSLFWYALGGITIAGVIAGLEAAHGTRPAIVVLGITVGVGAAITFTVRRTVLADAAAAVATTSTPASAAALLSCRGIDGGYAGVQILFGVDFELTSGEMVALLGTNGAGKSTFLKAITGLVTPTRGMITFDGRDITHLGPGACAELGIMAVPGGRGVFPTMTVADNLKAAAWMFRRDKAATDRGVERVLDHFPILRTRSGTLAGDLSGGEQQMLSLAQAFIADPKLLLIDELSLGLAPVIVEQLLEILRAIHERGTTIILVEQSVNTALELAERAIFMEKGQVRFSGPTKELLNRPDVLRAVFLQGAGPAPAPLQARAAARKIAAAPVVLSARELRKRYGGVLAVDDVSFDLHEHEILGFIGPNGAGKTSLFDLLSGFAKPDRGSVVLHGKDVTRLGAVGRADAGLGRSFQDARLWPTLTVAESLAVALHREGEIDAAAPALLGIPRVADSETAVHLKVDELIELMNLGAYRNKFVSELSTGTRRIVELGCLLAHRPSVLLLDEPSSGIAQRETEALGPLLRGVREELGCAILLIEHDIPLISALADRLVALELGCVIADGPPLTVLNEDRVVESYLGSRALKPGGAQPDGGSVPAARGARGPRGRTSPTAAAGRR